MRLCLFDDESQVEACLLASLRLHHVAFLVQTVRNLASLPHDSARGMINQSRDEEVEDCCEGFKTAKQTG